MTTAEILRNLATNSPPKGRVSVLTKGWRVLDDYSRNFAKFGCELASKGKGFSPHWSLTCSWRLQPKFCKVWPQISLQTEGFQSSLKLDVFLMTTAEILRNLAANSPPKGRLSVLTKAWACSWWQRPKFCEVWPRISLQREGFQSTLRLQGVPEDDGRNFAKFGLQRESFQSTLKLDVFLMTTAEILRNLATNSPPKGRVSVITKAWACSWWQRPKFCEIWPRIGLQRESFQSTLKLEVFLTTTAEILRNLAANWPPKGRPSVQTKAWGLLDDDSRNFAKFGRELASKGKAFSPH